MGLADGRPRLAAKVHNAALGDLHVEFAEVVDTATLLMAYQTTNQLGHSTFLSLQDR
jgi:hypothetical protein